MKAFEKFCWVMVLVMIVVSAGRLALLALLSSVLPADYIGLCAMAIVPYVFARAVQGFNSERLQGH